MSDTGIHLEGVWKKFRRGELHDSLRDLLPAITKRILRRGPPPDQLRKGDFWAVKDLSFEVRPGDTLGIVGGNGAGKSTVLKMITKILRPNRGWCEVRGRMGALIEIAAGFHPDLTGRENVYLQGSIRGMKGSLIKQQFDNIVEFSGIGEFIDTPVKRYSNGMNARLGFAIAAHLDPEVLIIDEVLAVGDFGFQSKAFNRINELATSGIPVIIVSHQLDRIVSLCNRAILMEQGAVIHQGTPTECITMYTSGTKPVQADHGGAIRVESVLASSDLPIRSGGEFNFELCGTVAEGGNPHGDSVYILVRSGQDGSVPFVTSTGRLDLPLPSAGPFRVGVALQMNLPAGVYLIETGAFSEKVSLTLSIGPSISVRIDNGPSFDGSVQLNPRMWNAQAVEV